MKGISREVIPYAVDGLAGDEMRPHVISEQATGVEIFVDIDAINKETAERTRHLLQNALAMLDLKRKPDAS
jgi:hypothetical protein